MFRGMVSTKSGIPDTKDILFCATEELANQICKEADRICRKSKNCSWPEGFQYQFREALAWDPKYIYITLKEALSNYDWD
jgi:hypothetical protein